MSLQLFGDAPLTAAQLHGCLAAAGYAAQHLHDDARTKASA